MSDRTFINRAPLWPLRHLLPCPICGRTPRFTYQTGEYVGRMEAFGDRVGGAGFVV